MEAGKSELLELMEEPKSETKLATEEKSLQQTPSPSKSSERTGGNQFNPLGSTPPSRPRETTSRVAFEHSYAKLVPSRSSLSTGNKDSSFSTVVLFSDRVSSKFKKKGLKGKKRSSTVKHGKVKLEEVHGEASNEEGELSTASVPMEVEPPRLVVGKGYSIEQTHSQIMYTVTRKWRILLMSPLLILLCISPMTRKRYALKSTLILWVRFDSEFNVVLFNRSAISWWNVQNMSTW